MGRYYGRYWYSKAENEITTVQCDQRVGSPEHYGRLYSFRSNIQDTLLFLWGLVYFNLVIPVQMHAVVVLLYNSSCDVQPLYTNALVYLKSLLLTVLISTVVFKFFSVLYNVHSCSGCSGGNLERGLWGDRRRSRVHVENGSLSHDITERLWVLCIRTCLHRRAGGIMSYTWRSHVARRARERGKGEWGAAYSWECEQQFVGVASFLFFVLGWRVIYRQLEACRYGVVALLLRRSFYFEFVSAPGWTSRAAVWCCKSLILLTLTGFSFPVFFSYGSGTILSTSLTVSFQRRCFQSPNPDVQYTRHRLYVYTSIEHTLNFLRYVCMQVCMYMLWDKRPNNCSPSWTLLQLK